MKKPFLPIVLLLCLLCNIARAQNCTTNAGLDQTICVTQPLVLTGTPGNPQSSPSAYLWTQVSGPAVTITTPTATSTTVTGYTPGNYVFQFSNKCIDNLFAVNLVSVTVLPEPPQAIAGADVANCSNTPVALSANAVSAPFTGTWTASPAGGTFSPNANAANATFTPPAGSNTYTLTWTISNGSCASSSSKLVKVVTPTSPVSAGSTITLSCNGSCATLNGSSPGVAPPQNGFWTQVSGPNTASFTNPNLRNTTVCNLVPGSYVFRWTVSGPCLTGSATVTVNVTNINTAPNAGGNQNYTTYCSGGGVTTQVLSGAALAAGETGQWTQTGGGTAPYPNVTFTPNTTGASVTVSGMTGTFPYVFTYVKTNAAGCSNSSTHTVYRSPGILNLSDPPDQNLACDATSTTFTISYDDATNITSGLTRAGLRLSAPAAAGSATYSTTALAGGTRTDTWTITGLTLAGTYIFRIEYRNSCGSVYRDIAVTVSRTPGTVNAGSDPILPCNTLTANPIGSATAPTNLTWSQVSGPNTATLSGVNNLSLTMSGLDAGVYRMRLTNSGGAACPSVTDDVLVKVTRALPTVATTGGNGTICSGRYRLTANTPGPLETGTWTVSPSAGITFLPNANTPNAFAVGLANTTAYTFTWTVSNSCGSINSSQVLTTTASAAPPIPDAGTDLCLPTGTGSTTLTGNAPAGATVLWRALTAGSSVAPPAAQATVVNFTGGSKTYLFEYALSTPGCTTFTDTVEVTVNNIIAAPNAGANQDICVATLPASTTVTATPVAPAGSVATWTQLSGPGQVNITSPNSASTTITGLTPGIYEFEYRIVTGSCAPQAATVVIRVAQEPSDAIAGSNIIRCSVTTGTTITLAATPPAVGSGYWQVISGPPGSGTPTFSNANLATSTITNLSQGTYILRWTTFNGPACGTKTSDMTIDVSAAASAGAAQSLCERSSATLTGNPNTTGTWTYLTGPAGSTVTGNSPNTAVVTGLTATPAGAVYTFRYSLPIIGACPASTSDVTLTNYSAPSAADAGLNQELCHNVSTATLTGNTPAIGTGSWAFISGPNTPTAGTANTNATDTVLTNLLPGIYIYEYRVNNTASCVASASRVQIIKEVTANAGANQRLCNAGSVNLAANAPVVNTGTWSLVSGPAGSTIANPNNPATAVSGLVTGTYVFRWTIAVPGGCGANSSDVTVIIDPPVPPSDAGTGQSFCEGTAAPFVIGTAAQPGVTYTWTPSALLSNPNIAQPTFTGVNNAGIFTYTVKGNIGACESYSSVTITVRPKPSVNINISAGVCSANFTASDVGSGIAAPVNYTWNFGTAPDANPASGTGAGPFNVVYKNGGTKTISLAISTGDGCTNSRSISFTPSCVLPIRLLAFNAAWRNNAAYLDWQTTNALNFDHFEVERSYDGISFETLATIPYGNATTFAYNDMTVNLGAARVYYRLKLADRDGSYTHSETRQLIISTAADIVAIPNPFYNQIDVRVKAAGTQQAICRLLDVQGQTVYAYRQAVTGAATVQLKGLDALTPGMYLLQVQLNGKTTTLKMLKR